MAIDVSEEIEALEKAREAPERPKIGWFCACAPHELIHAAGLGSFFVRSRRSDDAIAPTHLATFACSYLRKTLSDALEGAISLDGIFGVASCEAMRRHFEIWTRSVRPRFFYLLDVPKVDSAASRHYLHQKLEAAVLDIGRAFGTRLARRSIARAVRSFNRLRAALRRLDEIRAAKPGIIANRDFYEIVALSMEAPPDAASAVVDSLCRRISKSGLKRARAIPVAVSGNIVGDFSAFDEFDESGAAIVYDDLCAGSRFFSARGADPDRPLEAVVDRIFNSFTCAKAFDRRAKAPRFALEARRRGAVGVAFVGQADCDATLIERIAIAREAKRLGLTALFAPFGDEERTPGVRELLKELPEKIA